MKKILNFILNPKWGIGLGLLFFVIGFIDIELSGGNSFIEMSWWGKSAYVGFLAILAIFFVRFMLLPFGYMIVNLFKKKK